MNLISKERFFYILDNFKTSKPILVVGDVGIDKYTLGSVKRISPEAPVPVLEAKEETVKLGMAANISHNLNTLNLKSTLCGLIGKDINGELFKSILRKSNITLDGIIESKLRMTTCKERITTNVQQICRVDYETREMLDNHSEKSILQNVEKMMDAHGAIILEDYSKGVFSKNLTQTIIQMANQKQVICTVDPGRMTPPEYYHGAMLLKPNQDEAIAMSRSLGGRSFDLLEVANTLMEKLDLQMLVITLGAGGMALMDRGGDGRLKTIPTVAREVFDVSGAGDTSISTITAALLAKGTFEEAVWMGNCASGVVVGKRGTATVSCDELISFYNRINTAEFTSAGI
ncbi:MAG: hypothetical protein A2381_11040 [Bdellovibrionales bacterium RIFOXYB1_FULL_37_110]|nr:MAG: hypothetical protein A2181_01360 [Bdellovibrionales bacterium RIFOXYA1_FULL_38_20]OFZ48575.1 MAG: hypothetical protein A2417_09525 [Bdellovibrionales bacterium RIFOXYC1_FULL_37_79]OFZ58384.1 MAG: hypothetical protein A2381_11040 [Bdellovibrionales bacterium RIFOXYB1_FULL_37_110]OFZ62527.1 MAG: hypothetical protein A2577_01290 [Bdellovibrionales bacterium RIFOXYD1_FULL_36_51]